MVEQTNGNQEPHLESGESTSISNIEAEVDPKLSKIVNQIFGNRMREHTAEVKKLKLELAELREVKSKAVEPQAEAPVSKRKADPEMEALQKQVQLMLDEKNAEKGKRKQLEIETTLAGVLSAEGIPASAHKFVSAYLKANGAIGYESEESDAMIFKTGDSVYDLQDGIKNVFLKSEEAKVFIPAKGTSGSGDSRYSTIINSQSTIDPQKQKADFFGR